MHPFRGEKGTTWEGGFRVPTVVRRPGVIKPGTIYNDVMSHEDWMPTLVAAAGDPGIKEKLLKGMKVGDKMVKTHLDGYNFMPFFKGETDKGPRREFFYFEITATSTRSATTSGRSILPGSKGICSAASERARTFRWSSTCGRTRSSGHRLSPMPIAASRPISCGRSCPRRRLRLNSSSRSRITRPAREAAI